MTSLCFNSTVLEAGGESRGQRRPREAVTTVKVKADEG